MDTKVIIDKILSSHFSNDFRPTSAQIDLVDQLLVACDTQNPCELLISQAPDNYDNDKLAAIISMFMWQSLDNGAQVVATLETWAHSDNIRKRKVAQSEQIEVKLENPEQPT